MRIVTLLEKHPADTTRTDEISSLKESLRKYRRELSQVKRDLKKAKFRIHDLKNQKTKLLQKLKPQKPLIKGSKPGFFNQSVHSLMTK
jgi:chromosome segregation ATPase